MDEELRLSLLSMVREDLETRERLASDGSLFEGYHPEMQAVHERNAAVLDDVVREGGWPTPQRVGDDGSEAAWLIVQHAIGLPEFQRRCLQELERAAAQGAIPAWQPAMLLDRVRVLEGRPQVYGTSFDWDDDGLMSPQPIDDEAGVDERRKAVGLPPLDEAVARHRAQTRNEPKPADAEARRKDMDQWAKRVGWR